MKQRDKSGAPRQTPPDPKDRQDRLKAALQANIAKRKALARAKAGTGTDKADQSDD
jgi:hypothetical protein